MPDLRRPTWAMDGTGRPVNSLSGALNVHDADVHIHPVNHYFYQELATYALASPITSQNTSLTVTNATGIVAGSRLHITDTANSNHDHDILLVVTVVGNVVTVNRPIDKAYAIATTVIKRVTIEMTVVGSLASPQSFKLLPSPGEVWHLTSLDFSITDNAAMDDATFGGVPQLTNGVIIRGIDSTLNEYETFSHWRTNASFGKDGFSTSYSSKAPAGVYGFSGSLDFHTRYGAIVRLSNTTTEVSYMEILIQDDLSSLSTFEIKVHGHIETA